MRVAVVSDIHGNYHALESVLAAVDAEAPDEVWCLGDLVGYGPLPNECVARVRDRVDVCLAGNHDLGVLGTITLDEFSGDAGAAARWTRGVLGASERGYLAALVPQAARESAELFHGSPRDAVWEYVLSAEAAVDALTLTSAPVVLVGHSHVPLAITISDGIVEGGHAAAGTEIDLDGRWLLNPGSVGQPRDGDARAAWLLIDFDAGRAAFRRVPYPIESTQTEIRDRGLPDALAARLAQGV